MPNGLSGGFLVNRETLERVLNALPANEVVGMSPTPSMPSVDVSTVSRMLSEFSEISFGWRSTIIIGT